MNRSKFFALSAFVSCFIAGPVLAGPLFPDYNGPVKYPTGASLSDIATNEAIRLSIRGTPGVVHCRLIDTSSPTGKCVSESILEAGDGGAGPGSGAGK